MYVSISILVQAESEQKDNEIMNDLKILVRALFVLSECPSVSILDRVFVGLLFNCERMLQSTKVTFLLKSLFVLQQPVMSALCLARTFRILAPNRNDSQMDNLFDKFSHVASFLFSKISSDFLAALVLDDRGAPGSGHCLSYLLKSPMDYTIYVRPRNSIFGLNQRVLRLTRQYYYLRTQFDVPVTDGILEPEEVLTDDHFQSSMITVDPLPLEWQWLNRFVPSFGHEVFELWRATFLTLKRKPLDRVNTSYFRYLMISAGRPSTKLSLDNLSYLAFVTITSFCVSSNNPDVFGKLNMWTMVFFLSSFGFILQFLCVLVNALNTKGILNAFLADDLNILDFLLSIFLGGWCITKMILLGGLKID
jgi:hypothetical protein